MPKYTLRKWIDSKNEYVEWDVDCKADEVIVDEENRIVTTPAYMEAKCINEVALGIEKLVSQVLSLIVE